MRNVLLMLALILAQAIALSGGQHREFQTGKLINIATDERLYEGTSFRRAVFTVQVADLVYTARGQRVRSHSGDMGRGLVVGDALKVAIDGEDLIFQKPDGKEMKVKITKRERAK